MLQRSTSGLFPPIDRAAFRDGLRTIAPLSVPIAVWGVVTGAVMVNAGLSVPMALLMTITVYAGSAQLATLPLLIAGTPLPVIWATALVVNLRFVIFAAASRKVFVSLPRRQRLIAGYLNGDLGFALFTQRFADATEYGTAEQFGYFYGLNIGNWASWQVSSIAGVVLGEVVPSSWGLSLAAYLALLAVLVPMALKLPALAGVVVAGAVALVTLHFPMRTGLLVAVVAGVTVAMAGEAWAARRAKAHA
ncbi:MAG TPA: branched-chain amino acid transporter AzlC [Acidimicrobiaceae bacterium]|nr:branched-chain amino acid transporter AzlC [Acidimicrobiaceae bacterium]